MAKTVGDLLIKLGVDGLDGVTALKSALRTLGQASSASDKQLEVLRKEIVQVAKASNVSQQAIRGQIDAFKGLKAQASIGSTVYKRLGKDIDTLTQSLDRLSRKEDEVAKKPATTKQLAAQFTSAVPEKTTRQLQAQQEMLQKSAVSSVEYTQRLVRLNAVTQEFTRSQQRQAVIAGNVVAMTKAQAAQTLQSSKVNIENTHTTAALKQKIAELAQDLEHIDVGSKDYITTNNRLKETQQELNQVLGISSAAFDELSRAQERSARRAKKLADIQQYYGTSRTGEGQAAQRAGGFRDPETGAMIARGTRAGRASLVQQPMREISGLYRSIGDIGMSGISADIDRMGKSYQEVARDIKAATAASNGSINSLQAQRSAFAQLRAGLDPTSQDFRELGKEIEKVDRRLEKLNKRRRRPTIGGIAQGLGGIAAGGVFGGPEGAIGAAVGGAMGGVAGVAAGAALGAQAKMMREALGATSEYAAQLQKLEIALQGVAGAEYTDALKAARQVTKDFNVPLAVSTKGITRLSAAVIGAGGNVGDAEVVFRNITSAIKATGGGAQDVESAITAMVQTFSKGKVSAEELSGQLGERLPGAVTKFAEANNMTLPELQKAFKAGTVGLDQLMKFIISLGPEYEETARAIANSSADAGARAAVAFDEVRREVGEALQPIGAQLQQAFGKFVLDILPAIKAGAVAAANGLNALLSASSFLIKNFKELLIIAGAAGIVLALQNLIGIATALGTAFGKATVAMKGFTAASLLNPWVALAAGITAATVALVKHSKKNAEFNKSVIAGETTNKEANDRLREMNDKVQELEDRLGKETNNRMIQALTRQLKAAKIAAGDLELAMKLASSYEVAGIKYDRMTGRAINAPTSYTPTDFDNPDADSASGEAPMSMLELTLRRQMRDALEKENKVRQSILQKKLDLLVASKEEEGSLKRINMEEQARHEHAQRMNEINEEGLAIFDKQLDQRQQLERILRDAQFAAAGLTEEEKKRISINRQLAEFAEKAVEAGFSSEKIVKMLRDLRKALENAKDSAEDFSETFKNGLEEMINVGPKLANVALKAISGVADGLVDMIATGQANFRKFAAEILKDIAKIMMRAALAKAVKNIFFSADGNVIQSGQIKPYAKGGVVAAPTFFPMKGNNVGLMGEAGPEAILPLRRGPDGRLGVENTGASRMNAAMSRYSRNGVAPGQMTDADGMPAAGGMGGGSAALDVRYNVERINSVDYVTAAEFEQGMTQAAKRGAELGRRNVYSDLVNKRSIRSRVAL
tara:strand:+ start:1615 stop:5418 length:3804 start_codon:yes stop_codon:yes gene_type:complete